MEELLIAKTSHATAKEEGVKIITFTPEMIDEHSDSGGGGIILQLIMKYKQGLRKDESFFLEVILTRNSSLSVRHSFIQERN